VLDAFTVHWTQSVDTLQAIASSTTKLPNLDNNGFYALLGGRWNDTTKKWSDLELLYIGQAFDQTLRTRILQPHDAYTCIEAQLEKTGKTAIVMVGVVTQASVQRLTQDVIDDLECCLIYSNQPLCNERCKDTYSGREITITNIGGNFPLKASSACP